MTTQMSQMTREEAVAFAQHGLWRHLSVKDRGRLQLCQSLLCMPLEAFHEGIEALLGRPVFTHEFAFMDRLRSEAEGHMPTPSLFDILELIPADKRVVLDLTK